MKLLSAQVSAEASPPPEEHVGRVPLGATYGALFKYK